jgi:hypothetical protein
MYVPCDDEVLIRSHEPTNESSGGIGACICTHTDTPNSVPRIVSSRAHPCQ